MAYQGRARTQLTSLGQMHDQLRSGNYKWFSEDGWNNAVKTGNQDAYAAAIINSNDVDIKQRYLLSKDSVMLSLYNELGGNHENKDTTHEYIDYEDGAEVNKTFVGSDYDFNNFMLDRERERGFIALQNDQKRKWTQFEKIMNESGVVLNSFSVGFINFFQDLTALVGASNHIEMFKNWKESGYGNILDVYINNLKQWQNRLGKDALNEAFTEYKKEYAPWVSADETLMESNGAHIANLLESGAQSLGQMAGSMLLTAGIGGVVSATGGAVNSATQGLGKAGEFISSGVFYGSIVSNDLVESYDRYKKSGMSTQVIVGNVLARNIAQYAVEVVLGKILGSSISDRFVFGRASEGVITKAFNKLPTGGKVAANLLYSAFEEGLEEVFQDTSDFLINTAFADIIPNAEIINNYNDISWRQIGDSFLIGAMNSLIIGGIGIAMTNPIVVNTFDENGKFKFDKDGNVITEKLGKLASWQLGIDLQSMNEAVSNLGRFVIDPQFREKLNQTETKLREYEAKLQKLKARERIGPKTKAAIAETEINIETTTKEKSGLEESLANVPSRENKEYPTLVMTIGNMLNTMKDICDAMGPERVKAANETLQRVTENIKAGKYNEGADIEALYKLTGDLSERLTLLPKSELSELAARVQYAGMTEQAENEDVINAIQETIAKKNTKVKKENTIVTNDGENTVVGTVDNEEIVITPVHENYEDRQRDIDTYRIKKIVRDSLSEEDSNKLLNAMKKSGVKTIDEALTYLLYSSSPLYSFQGMLMYDEARPILVDIYNTLAKNNDYKDDSLIEVLRKQLVIFFCSPDMGYKIQPPELINVNKFDLLLLKSELGKLKDSVVDINNDEKRIERIVSVVVRSIEKVEINEKINYFTKSFIRQIVNQLCSPNLVVHYDGFNLLTRGAFLKDGITYLVEHTDGEVLFNNLLIRNGLTLRDISKMSEEEFNSFLGDYAAQLDIVRKKDQNGRYIIKSIGKNITLDVSFFYDFSTDSLKTADKMHPRAVAQKRLDNIEVNDKPLLRDPENPNAKFITVSNIANDPRLLNDDIIAFFNEYISRSDKQIDLDTLSPELAVFILDNYLGLNSERLGVIRSPLGYQIAEFATFDEMNITLYDGKNKISIDNILTSDVDEFSLHSKYTTRSDIKIVFKEFEKGVTTNGYVKDNVIYLNKNFKNFNLSDMIGRIRYDQNKSAIRRTIVHELTHMLQHHNAWINGGNPRLFIELLKSKDKTDDSKRFQKDMEKRFKSDKKSSMSKEAYIEYVADMLYETLYGELMGEGMMNTVELCTGNQLLMVDEHHLMYIAPNGSTYVFNVIDNTSSTTSNVEGPNYFNQLRTILSPEEYFNGLSTFDNLTNYYNDIGKYLYDNIENAAKGNLAYIEINGSKYELDKVNEIITELESGAVGQVFVTSFNNEFIKNVGEMYIDIDGLHSVKKTDDGNINLNPMTNFAIIPYSEPIQERTNLTFDEYKKRWEKFSKKNDYSEISQASKMTGKYVDRVLMLDENGNVIRDKSGRPRFKYLYDTSRRSVKITKADIENDPAFKNFNTKTMTPTRKALIMALDKVTDLPRELKTKLDNGSLTIVDVKEYFANAENINEKLFDEINNALYKNRYIDNDAELNVLVDNFDKLAASIQIINKQLRKQLEGKDVDIENLSELGSKVDNWSPDELLDWADNYSKKSAKNAENLSKQMNRVSQKVVFSDNRGSYIDLDIKPSLLRNLFMEYYDGSVESIYKISIIARESAYLNQYTQNKIISLESKLGEDSGSRSFEEVIGGEEDSYYGNPNDTFTDLFNKGELDEKGIEVYKYLFTKYIMEQSDRIASGELSKTTAIANAKDKIDTIDTKPSTINALYEGMISDKNFDYENAIKNIRGAQEIQKAQKQEAVGEAPYQLSRKLKNVLAKIRRTMSVTDYKNFVKTNEALFNKDGSINRNAYMSNNRIEVGKIKNVINQLQKTLDEYSTKQSIDIKKAIAKAEREAKRIIKKQEQIIKKQKKTIEKLSHTNFTFRSTVVTIDSSVPMPSKLKTLLETTFDNEKLRVSKTQEVGEQEFIRHNASKFFEENNDLLARLSTEEALEMVDFFTKGGIRITGELLASQQVNAVALWTLSYMYKGNKLSQFNFSIEEATRLREQINSFVSTSAMTLSLWRDMLKDINPVHITLESASESAEIAFRNDDLRRLSDAVNANDLNRMQKIKQEMYDNTVKDYADLNTLLRERAKLRKEGKDIKDVERRIKNTEVFRRFEMYDAMNETKLAETVLKSNGINKATVLERILKWEQISMLSSPGTWLRNFFTNTIIGGVSTTKTGLNNLSGLLGDKATSIMTRLFPKLKEQTDSITGQYKIVGTKVTDQVKNFINNIDVNTMYDLVSDGLIKYFDNGSISHESAEKSLQDLVIESVMTKLRIENRYDPMTNKLSGMIFKVLSDDKFVKRATISYFGKILTEKSADIKNWQSLNRITMGYFAEAYALAAYDYMHKRNFINRIENNIKSRLGDKAFFIYKQIFPFAAASTNWFLEGLNYTPMGLVKAITNFAKLEKNIERIQIAYQRGDASYDSAFTKYIITRNIGKGLIGSVGWMIGALLVAIGRVRLDEDKDKYMLKAGNVNVDISALYSTQGIFLGMTTMGLLRDMIKNGGSVDAVADIFTQTFNTMFEDSTFASMWNTFRWTDGIGESITLAPYTMLNMMIPNFVKTLTATSMAYKVSYSGGILNKIERLGASIAPWGFDKQIDPYTGKAMLLYGGHGGGSLFKTYLANIMNKYTELKVYPYEVSEAEKEATFLGVRKAQLTGKWVIGDKKISLSTNDKEELNRFYGELNEASLSTLMASKTKYKVQDEDGKYVELTYNKMTDKEKAAVIKRLMSDNSGYAKIYLLTKDGEYKYYATESEYAALRNAGVTKNIYRATDKKKGFYKS